MAEKKNQIIFLSLIVGLILLLGVVAYVVFAGEGSLSGFGAASPSPSPVLPSPQPSPSPLPSPSPTPEATPEATVSAKATTKASPSPTASPKASPVGSPTSASTTTKKDIAITVQNGTTISGQAGKVKSALTAAGFTSVETGNASSQSATVTTLKVAKSVPSSTVDEVEAILVKMFKNVETETVTSTPTKSLIQIITGTPK